MVEKSVSLQDMLVYQPETYFKPEELALIQNTFKDSKVTKVLRKALLPSVGDLDLPIEEMGKDLWLVGRDYSAIPEAEVKSIVLARQEAIKFVMGGLIQLKQIANSAPVSDQVKAGRNEKNSTK